MSFAVSGTGCGTVSPISGNTGAGNAAVSATYTAGTTVGFCTVTATESINGASGTVTIAQSTPVAIFPPTVTFSPALASVAVSTTNTNLFTVTVANPGAVVSDPLSVAVTGAGCSDATAVLTSPATNASGQDTVTYKAGAGLVACTVTVKEADAGSSGSAVVTQTRPVTSVAVSVSPLVVAHTTGTANITVTVTNPVAGDIGVAVAYSVAPVTLGFASCGTVASVTPLSSGGIAYATYTAGAGVGGFCTITAKTAVSLDSGTVNGRPGLTCSQSNRSGMPDHDVGSPGPHKGPGLPVFSRQVFYTVIRRLHRDLGPYTVRLRLGSRDRAPTSARADASSEARRAR